MTTGIPPAAGIRIRSSRSTKRSAASPPGAARAAFAEDRLGILRPGFRADLTVVDRDLFKVSPKEVLEARVNLTIIDGQVVYQRKSP